MVINMKRRLPRLLAALLAAVMLISLSAGCRRNPDDPNGEAETPDFVYVPEFISLPEGIMDISMLVYANEKLFFSSWYMSEEEPYSYGNKLFSMNMDGSDLKELSNYSPTQPPEGAMGNVNINALRVDEGGNLWVAENGDFYGFDLPEDFDEEHDEMWQYYYHMGNTINIRKLDGTGAELISVDISALSNNVEYFWIRTFEIDSDNNLYIATDQTIHVLDSSGKVQFKLEVSNWIDQLIRLPDGAVAFFGYTESGRVLRKINFATRSWGEDVEMPSNAYNIFRGGGDYSIIYTDYGSLFGIETSSGESVKLLSWIDSDVSSDGLNNITLLPDGRVMCTTQSWNRVTSESTFQLILLTRMPYETLPPRTVLTLATMWLDWNLRNAIIEFNRSSDVYRIRVNDYSEFNTEEDWQAGLTRMTTEIISGKVPDILDVSSLPYKQYVARGLLEDLYPFIDSDPYINRGDLMDSIFRAAEMNGSLYQIFSTFYISTLIGNPKVLGPGMGWTMNEFRDVLRANPQADMPMGMGYTKNAFLQSVIVMSMDEYVDWATGMCYFDRGGFADLLEFANMFPDEFDWSRDEYIDPGELIATGRQIMMNMGISDFMSVRMYTALFGGEIVFKGFPSDNKRGNSLSIGSSLSMTTRCRSKEGAWQFMRTVLTEEWQTNNNWGFPTNKAAFDTLLKDAMTPRYFTDEYGNQVEESQGGWGWGDTMIEIYALTQREADNIMDLINSVSGTASYNESLMMIINEGAEDFFSGRSSAQEAARVIQSRASIYVAEQS